MKDLPEEEKPREKAKEKGLESLTTVELIAILLRTGTKELSVKDLSIEILKKYGGLEGFKNLRISNLMSQKGLGEVKAITLLAAIELGRRMKWQKTSFPIKITETKDVYENYHHLFLEETQEKFLVLFLDTKNFVRKEKIIFMGTANQSIVHPRDIFKEAILNNAVKIICIHNHPTGDVTPSEEDKIMTRRLEEVGKIVGIPLLDHVILGERTYYSFLEGGYLS